MVELPIDAFKKLINQMVIKQVEVDIMLDQSKIRVLDRFLTASPEDLEKANRKYAILKSYWDGVNIELLDVKPRTLRSWNKKFRDSEKTEGNGFVGLLPKTKQQGNRVRRLSSKVINLMEEYITQKYENIRGPYIFSIYKRFKEECKKKRWDYPSFVTFWNEAKKRPIYEQRSKRFGPKASYDLEKFYFEIEQTTPRHGDFPFQICHIDHTELDIELVCSETGKNLRKPWVTFLVDAYSRRILSFYLSFDAPSYRSCMMVLRECVRRHSRFPKTVIVDGGKDFQSVYFETLLAAYKCTKQKRPGSKPKFGSVCERLFGTTNQIFIHNLLGNTKIMKNIRQVSKKFNPQSNAVWTFENLFEMMQQWCYEVYDKTIHSTLGINPRECYNQRVSISGKRKHTYIAYDQTFNLLTMPTTRTGAAKVQPNEGVRINNIRYWSDLLEHPEVEGTSVNVRYDPFNMGVAYAFVFNRWIKLLSEYVGIFENRTEKEIKIATQEIRKRLKSSGVEKDITGSIIAEFLTNVESKEVLYLQQLRDKAVRNSVKGTNDDKAKEKSTKVVDKNKTTPNRRNSTNTNLKNNSDIDQSFKQFVFYGEF